MAGVDLDYGSLISESTTTGRLYTDPQVFRDEMARIWHAQWLFVAHESEIPEPGDYCTRTLGGVPVVAVRTDTGDIAVLLNRCPHRGNAVCLSAFGNSRHFRCAYHGWTFHTDGSLATIPLAEAYDPCPAIEPAMQQLPAVTQYGGLVFAALAPQNQSLEEYLGKARHLIDECAKRSPKNRLRVVGVQRVRVRANWKIILDNGTDGYHGRFVHQSAIRLDPAVRELMSRAMVASSSVGTLRDLGNGITQLDYGEDRRETGYTLAVPDGDPVLARYRDEFPGERVHLSIFPNLLIMHSDFRVIIPIASDISEFHQYFYELDGATPEVNHLRLRRQEATYGAAGAILQDDVDVWERTQRGLQAQASFADDRLDLSRGCGREVLDADGFRVDPHAGDELGLRNSWARYRSLMTTECVRS